MQHKHVQLTLLNSCPGVMRYWAYKNVGICAWTGRATKESVQVVQETVDELLLRSPFMFSFIHLVAERVPLPDAGGRAGLVALMKTYESRTACAAIVIGGSGFWTSGMRSAVTGLRLLAPRSFEYRVHGSIADVPSWLPQVHTAKTGVEIVAADLNELLTQAERCLRHSE